MKPSDFSLIIGVDSSLGSSIQEFLHSRHKSVIGTSRRKKTLTDSRFFLDLSQKLDTTWTPPEEVSVVYFCAAVTSLEACRTDPKHSALVNVHNTVSIARKCSESGIQIIFPSTSQVFDGTIPHRKPYDVISPMTEYGRQKAEAERKILELGKDVTIVRFNKIINSRLPLIRQWIDSLISHQKIFPFSDYTMAPVSISLAVECICRLAEGRNSGIFHISAPEDITYADAAVHIAKRLHIDSELVSPKKIADSGIKFEHNPCCTSLDSSDIENKLGIIIPDAFLSIDRTFFP